jgi:hypothetical protein
MGSGFQRIIFFVDGRKYVAQVYAADRRLLVDASTAKGLSLGAYVAAAGSVENALRLAREMRSPAG